ncbi:TonB-dependent receptor plug domain-containing protein [Sunxiuqinia sp. A32]|uniref:TonB-dependent receptor plug domain-containing protein n=1 Tax=Sunxiuqinia sp. A32 TaxID=3461496 RepID=UPI0040458601
MKSNFYPFVILLALATLSASQIFSQSISPSYKNGLNLFLESYPNELVYVHSDREVYSEIDTIWYKTYLVNGNSFIPESGKRNIYVELIDQSDSIRLRKLVHSTNGFGNGDISIPECKINPGKYTLRAYTNYQQNFSSEFLFSKNILVEKLRKYQSNTDVSKPDDKKHDEIDLQFFPEGGYLTHDISNRLAFKATLPNGHSANISGWVFDDQGNKTGTFDATHTGMGTFNFIPRKGVNYTAKVDGFPKQSFELPESTNKIQLSVYPQKDTVLVCLNANLQAKESQQYYLVNSSNGIVNFYLPVEFTGKSKEMGILKSKFENGINQLTLTDEKLRPIAERLIFVCNEELLSIHANTNKDAFHKREKVTVDLTTMIDYENTPANLSVSVVNQSQDVRLEDHPQNILTYLLLNSELKGHIENPSCYFENDDMETRNKLDLLMRCQGWRNYLWDQFDEKLPSTEFEKEDGLVISGMVNLPSKKKKADSTKVSMTMRTPDDMVFMDEAFCDKKGYFEFPPMVFHDSTLALMQAFTKRNHNREILSVSSFIDEAPISKRNGSFMAPGESKTFEFNKKASERFADLKYFHPDKYNILVDDVVVTAKLDPKKQKEDGHRRIYTPVSDPVIFDDRAGGYSDVFEYLSGKVAGLKIKKVNGGYQINLRGSFNWQKGLLPPLILRDGLPIKQDDALLIPVSEIDKIEVLKDASEIAMFGVRGAGGVISIFTKRGMNEVENLSSSFLVNKKLRGYSASREFYNPKYDVLNTEEPDRRATLYWEPNLETDNSGKSSFSFWTSDDKAPILIKVEGISKNGEPGVAFINLEMTGELTSEK